MNSRERVIRAIEMDGPDRVPLTHATLHGAYVRYGAELDDLYRQYPSDVVNVGSATSGEFGAQVGVPSRVGADADRASWTLNGTLRITTRDGATR